MNAQLQSLATQHNLELAAHRDRHTVVVPRSPVRTRLGRALIVAGDRLLADRRLVGWSD